MDLKRGFESVLVLLITIMIAIAAYPLLGCSICGDDDDDPIPVGVYVDPEESLTSPHQMEVPDSSRTIRVVLQDYTESNPYMFRLSAYGAGDWTLDSPADSEIAFTSLDGRTNDLVIVPIAVGETDIILKFERNGVTAVKGVDIVIAADGESTDSSPDVSGYDLQGRSGRTGTSPGLSLQPPAVDGVVRLSFGCEADPMPEAHSDGTLPLHLNPLPCRDGQLSIRYQDADFELKLDDYGLGDLIAWSIDPGFDTLKVDDIKVEERGVGDNWLVIKPINPGAGTNSRTDFVVRITDVRGGTTAHVIHLNIRGMAMGSAQPSSALPSDMQDVSITFNCEIPAKDYNPDGTFIFKLNPIPCPSEQINVRYQTNARFVLRLDDFGMGDMIAWSLDPGYDETIAKVSIENRGIDNNWLIIEPVNPAYDRPDQCIWQLR